MTEDQESLAELTRAKRARDEAREAVNQKRGEFNEAKEAYKERCKTVEEILEQLTGDRPLLAAIAAKAAKQTVSNGTRDEQVPASADYAHSLAKRLEANGTAEKPSPKRTPKPEPALNGLQLPTVRETIDGFIDPMARSIDELHVNIPGDGISWLKAKGIKTVGEVLNPACEWMPGWARIPAREFVDAARSTGVLSSEIAPSGVPDASNGKLAADQPREWSQDDIDAELLHATTHACEGTLGGWGSLIEQGADQRTNSGATRAQLVPALRLRAPLGIGPTRGLHQGLPGRCAQVLDGRDRIAPPSSHPRRGETDRTRSPALGDPDCGVRRASGKRTHA